VAPQEILLEPPAVEGGGSGSSSEGEEEEAASGDFEPRVNNVVNFGDWGVLKVRTCVGIGRHTRIPKKLYYTIKNYTILYY
jgi:hypothetical protein